MAAVSAPHAASALTPPSSPHGGQSSWNFSVPAHGRSSVEYPNSHLDNDYTSTSDRQPTIQETSSSTALPQHSRPDLSNRRPDTFNSANSSRSNLAGEFTHLAPARIGVLNRKDSNISDTGSVSDSLLDLYGPRSASRSAMNSMDLSKERIGGSTATYNEDEDSEHSRWIHRDKLARIESQELQAAGIILPRTRAFSKSSRRERSRDQSSSGLGRSEQSEQVQKRQRRGSFPTDEPEESGSGGWDLRLPEEAEDDLNSYQDYGFAKGSSRIPLSKTSPLPVPIEYIERPIPVQRSRSSGWSGSEDPMAYPKPRERSHSIKQLEENTASPTPAKIPAADASPTKKVATSAPRNGSAPAMRGGLTTGRPKTRSSSTQNASAQRPSTRSGEGGTKKPEGDPPWLASMYKPDPRLPPDQQILPTVAKRLQQEQWEKEGKFGNAYDTKFRPLNDEEFAQRPATVLQTVETPDPEAKLTESSEWPLRSPTLSTGRPGTAGGYSTMPKIHEAPKSPLPKNSSPLQPLRFEEPPEGKKRGCGLCIVM